MRKRYEKKTGKGRPTKTINKELTLNTIQSGKDKNGQRHSLNIIFYNYSYKKASDSNYIVVEFDDKSNQLYFVPANEEKGYKLQNSTKDGSNKRLTFSIKPYELETWEAYKGEYNLKKDLTEGLYYIDLKKGGD